jgi:hypothetical protein
MGLYKNMSGEGRFTTVHTLCRISFLKEYCHLVCDVTHSYKSLLMFVRNILPPSSGWRRKTSKQTSKQSQHSLCSLLACLLDFSTLTLEIVCSSVTLVNFYQTTWRHIPEHGNPHNDSCKNLNCHFFFKTSIFS